MKCLSAALLFVFFLSGCAAPINAHNAQSYARNASLAVKQGDWDTARRMWAGAVVNSSLAHADKRYQAVMNYEYARSLGVTCFYELAQQYFDKAYALDRETNGPAYMSSFELANKWGQTRLNSGAVGPPPKGLAKIGGPSFLVPGMND